MGVPYHAWIKTAVLALEAYGLEEKKKNSKQTISTRKIMCTVCARVISSYLHTSQLLQLFTAHNVDSATVLSRLSVTISEAQPCDSRNFNRLIKTQLNLHCM
jgi:hypothetical protein